jgi:hypothetical protein
MKPPTIKLNKHYSLKYIQVPYDNRYYIVKRGNIKCCRIKCSETEFLDYFIRGVYSCLDPLEVIDLAKRYEKFKTRVEKKNKILDKP